MTKKKITILLTIILIISLGIVGGFWYSQRIKSEKNSIESDSIKTEHTRLFLVKEINNKLVEDSESGEGIKYIDTDNWITYWNKELGIEFKYPKEFKVINGVDDKSLFASFKKIYFLNEQSEKQAGLFLTEYTEKKDVLSSSEAFHRYLQYYLNKKILNNYEGSSSINSSSIIGTIFMDTSDNNEMFFNGYYFNEERIYILNYSVFSKIPKNIWLNILATVRIDII